MDFKFNGSSSNRKAVKFISLQNFRAMCRGIRYTKVKQLTVYIRKNNEKQVDNGKLIDIVHSTFMIENSYSRRCSKMPSQPEYLFFREGHAPRLSNSMLRMLISQMQ